MQQYNDDWRQKRKLVSQEFTPAVVHKYHAIQEKQARLLVQNLVKDSSKLVAEIKLYVFYPSSGSDPTFHSMNSRIGLLIFRVTYGYYPKSAQDYFLQLSFASMENFIHSATPGNFLVEIFPSRKRLVTIPEYSFFLKSKPSSEIYAIMVSRCGIQEVCCWMSQNSSGNDMGTLSVVEESSSEVFVIILSLD